jgi:hypothetical protein
VPSTLLENRDLDTPAAALDMQKWLLEPIGRLVEHRPARNVLKTLHLRPKGSLLEHLAGAR